MRPKTIIPELLTPDGPYVRDKNSGKVWHRSSHRTLYADTDRSQVVYHANYLRYFEFGRASLMRDADYPYKKIEESGFIYPIIEIGLNYYTPLYYDDLMLIHTRPMEIERVRLRFEYLLTNAESGELICTGFTRHCAVNVAGVPVEIDDKTHRLWRSFPR